MPASKKRSSHEGTHKSLKPSYILANILTQLSYVTKLIYLATKPENIYTYLALVITYLYLNSLPDMNTSTGSSARKSLCDSLTAQYDERVASTLEKVDPNGQGQRDPPR